MSKIKTIVLIVKTDIIIKFQTFKDFMGVQPFLLPEDLKIVKDVLLQVNGICDVIAVSPNTFKQVQLSEIDVFSINSSIFLDMKIVEEIISHFNCCPIDFSIASQKINEQRNLTS
jgi:hypothetical protein